LKTEPESYSIQDLAAAPDRTTSWDGIRNYQARNFLRDAMKAGDSVLLYHSSADPPAIVGTATVVGPARPDPTAWDPADEHFDPRSTPEAPVWYAVDIRLESKPVSAAEWKLIVGMGRKPTPSRKRNRG
jgi:predicted RNA-binding protein with PUA-like domain